MGTHMISLSYAKELIKRFYASCPKKFNYFEYELTCETMPELLALPMLWAHKLSPKEFNQILSVEFTPNKAALFGFTVDVLEIKNKQNPTQNFLCAGQHFASELKYGTLLILCNDLKNYIQIGLDEQNIEFSFLISTIFDLKFNKNGMQPQMMDLLDKAIVDEIFEDDEDLFIDDSLLEDLTEGQDTGPISAHEPDVYYFFDDEQPQSTAGQLTDLGKASDCLSQENKKFEALSDKPHTDEYADQNSITKESKAGTKPMCNQYKKLTYITVEQLLENGDETILSLIEQLAWIDLAYAQSKNGAATSTLVSSKEKTKGTVLTEKYLLQALYGCQQALDTFAQSFNIPSFMVEFPHGIIEERARILKHADNRTFYCSVAKANTSWYDAAKTREKSLVCSIFIQDILKAICREDKYGKIVLRPNQLQNLLSSLSQKQQALGSTHASKDLFVDFLSRNLGRGNWSNQTKYAKVKEMKCLLRDQIIGQRLAINQISDQLSAMLFSPKREHLGVSTFFGLSGTGKTQTANTIANILNATLSLDYQLFSIAMEVYNEDKDVMKLWGSGSQYVDSALGDLTQRVMHSPRQIILFDEIEKAHPEVIQSLLTLLSSGKANDKTLERTVDFSQCLFIFTTNLGSTRLAEMPENIILDSKQLLSEKATNKAKAFSPEMINRLSSGNIVMFKKLTSKDLVKIAQKNIDSNKSMTSVDWNECELEILIRTLGHDLSPRSLQRQLDKIFGKIVNEMIDVDAGGSNLDSISINIEPIISKHAPSICLISNRKWGNSLAQYDNVTVREACSMQSINLALNEHADITLLDETSLTVDCRLLSKALENFEQQLIMSFGFSSTPSALEKSASSSALHEYLVTTERFSRKSISKFLDVALNRFLLIEGAENALNRNLQVAYDIEVHDGKFKTEVLLKNFTHQQSTRVEDLDLTFAKIEPNPNSSFDDIIGLDGTKKRLKLILNWLQNSDKKQAPKIQIPKGYLFAGRPGTGKTQMARSLAGEADARFINVNAADLLTNDPIKSINDLFTYAKRIAPSIIFIDEIDSIARDRANSSNSYAAMVNALLTAMDGFNVVEKPVFVLAATNNPKQLDSALIRPGRLERVINFTPPDLDSRLHYLKKKLEHRICDTEAKQHIEHIAKFTAGFTIGELDLLIRETDYLAIENERAWSIYDVKEQVSNIQFGSKRLNFMVSESSRRKTAYHEAGHLIAARILEPNVAADFVSIEATSFAYGMVVFSERELNQDSSLSKRKIKNKIQVALAGLAAEHMLGLMGEDAETGAANDRKVATRMAKDAIMKLGLSDNFGLLIPEEMPVDPQALNKEVNAWLETAFENVKVLLEEHRELLDFFSSQLLEKDRLEKDFIDAEMQRFVEKGKLQLVA
jgi:cell division protease FtsH